MKQPHEHTNQDGKVLILKRIPQSRKTYNNFHWEAGQKTFTARDWDSVNTCGFGLHGWPWGVGLGEGSDYDIIHDIWLVLAADPGDVVGNLDKGWKCKAKTVDVVFEGDFKSAWEMVREGFHACLHTLAEVGTQASSGNNTKQASSGNNTKQASSGDYTQQASSGDYTQQASSGNNTKQASSGYNTKQASSGYNTKQASSGYDCVAVNSGLNGRVKVGERGVFALTYYTEETGYEILVGKVGRDGIKPHTWYEVRDGKIVECEI